MKLGLSLWIRNINICGASQAEKWSNKTIRAVFSKPRGVRALYWVTWYTGLDSLSIFPCAIHFFPSIFFQTFGVDTSFCVYSIFEFSFQITCLVAVLSLLAVYIIDISRETTHKAISNYLNQLQKTGFHEVVIL